MQPHLSGQCKSLRESLVTQGSMNFREIAKELSVV